ncbi:hypothetical protein H8356DRAFT_1087644 [Neocallimastix lanati (nom. inval.)]|nr:hypothetical protein H8356DRAFT_1087644 [Neocallimastix sp. JGI-2020a]
MKLLIFIICIFLANCALAKESRVFCQYNYNRVYNIYDPGYFDNEGNIVYAKTIEEYAKVLGPTWYGVSWYNNSIMVNSIGNIESNTDTLIDKISNTIEVASTITDDNTITYSHSNTDTSSLEVAVTLAHFNSTSESSDNRIYFYYQIFRSNYSWSNGR